MTNLINHLYIMVMIRNSLIILSAISTVQNNSSIKPAEIFLLSHIKSNVLLYRYHIFFVITKSIVYFHFKS